MGHPFRPRATPRHHHGSGEALEVQNRDGSALVVTVDDADTAARLLSAVAQRATAAG
jgi:hypothetical protein